MGKKPKVKTLPRILSLAGRHHDGRKVTSLEGYRIIQFLGARIDLEQATSSVYALAGAIFVDLIQDRQSMEKFVIAIDVREGSGWRNHPAHELISFIKEIISLTPVHHPERMQTTFLYPIPSIAIAVWNCIQPFLDLGTREKIKLLAGPAKVKDRVPEELEKYLSKDTIKYLEKNRKSLFNVK